MSVAVATLALIALLLGLLLAWAAARLRRDDNPLADAIENVLPQTQCAQCGFPGCRPYAEAIARGDADINQCPPGGDAGIRALAQLLGREAKALAPQHGVEKAPAVALIHEAICIGCTKCIQACPVDAIVGAPKLMHTVLADECTGCELCIPPCPVDCISLERLGAAALRTRAAAVAVARPIAAGSPG